MLQVARLASKQLNDSAELVEGFVRSQLNRDGGFKSRDGESDLYYTVFGLECLTALRCELPVAEVSRYLTGFGNGEDLDFVHLTCLARCWANVTKDFSAVPRERILARLERHRTADGGYGQVIGAPHCTVYSAFLATGAYQDFGVPVPQPERIIAGLDSLRAFDGGIANTFDAPEGVTPATAAFVTLSRQLDRPPEPAFGQWLLARHLPDGGFFAAPKAQVPDLLSTATALHALSVLRMPLDDIREKCLDFIDSLWTNRGGFYGHWYDILLDVEYTYYALLSLGHLAV